ncbi:hypothetical protein NGRA_2373 [Nosema granulosis]|uniref:Uncharacterized protein n=1 Tax=Nosema granulosis TaxID=83296 RepID=A0A9P6GXL3_9MICR|nr:hypothetical protein NGRA_2373 [Nosema granulosis]
MKIYIFVLCSFYMISNIECFFDNVYFNNIELVNLCFENVKESFRELYRDTKENTFVIHHDLSSERRNYLVLIDSDLIRIIYCNGTKFSKSAIKTVNFKKPSSYYDIVFFIVKKLKELHGDSSLIEAHFMIEKKIYSREEEFKEQVENFSQIFANLPSNEFLIKGVHKYFKNYISKRYVERERRGGDYSWISLIKGNAKLITNINESFKKKLNEKLKETVKNFEDVKFRELSERYNIGKCTSIEEERNLFMFYLCSSYFEYLHGNKMSQNSDLYFKKSIARLFIFISSKRLFKDYLINKTLVNKDFRERIIKALEGAIKVVKSKFYYKKEDIKDGDKGIDIYENIMFIRNFSFCLDVVSLYEIVDTLVLDLNSLSKVVMSKGEYFDHDNSLTYRSDRNHDMEISWRVWLKSYFEYTETNEIVDDNWANLWVKYDIKDFDILKDICYGELIYESFDSSYCKYSSSFVDLMEFIYLERRRMFYNYY